MIWVLKKHWSRGKLFPYFSLMSFGGEEHYWRRDTGELSVKRRKQNLSTYSRPPPQHDLFDADPFDSELREDLEESAGDWPGPSMPSERYIPVKTGSHSGIEVRHVDITSEGNHVQSCTIAQPLTFFSVETWMSPVFLNSNSRSIWNTREAGRKVEKVEERRE